MSGDELRTEIETIGAVTTSGLLFELTQKYEADKKALNLKKRLAQYYETNTVASTSPEMLQLTSFFEAKAAVIQEARMAEFRRRLANPDTQDESPRGDGDDGSGGESDPENLTTPVDPIPAPQAAAGGGAVITGTKTITISALKKPTAAGGRI